MSQNGAANPTESANGESGPPNLESMVTNLLRSFMDIFTGHEFLRMRAQYSQFDPADFM